MKYSILYFFLLSLLGCSSEYINKQEYNVVVGETIEIFYGDNSCCGRCWNDSELDHLAFLENKKIEFDEDCTGCTNTYSKSYKAVSEGVDTLKTKSYAMSDSCNLDSGDVDIFVVKIKKSL